VRAHNEKKIVGQFSVVEAAVARGITLLFCSNLFLCYLSSARCVFYDAVQPSAVSAVRSQAAAKQPVAAGVSFLRGMFAFADQIWTPTRAAASVQVSATQCLKWSKKEAGSLLQTEVECPLPRNFFKFIFDLKMASFDALLGDILCDLQLNKRPVIDPAKQRRPGLRHWRLGPTAPTVQLYVHL